MSSLLREPLLHFVVLGALFATVRATAARTDDAHVVRVTRATREHLVRELEWQLGRAATTDERNQAIARWKSDEVVYREAVRLGVDRTDPQLTARMAARALEVFRGLEIQREPTDTELTGFLEANRARYEVPERYTIEHAFAKRGGGDAEARAKGFAASAARQGKELSALGDVYDVGAKLEEVAFEDLARIFGFEFAQGVSRAKPGEVVVLESTRGFHAVRVVDTIPAGLPDEALLLPRLVRDWKASLGDELKEKAEQRLLSRYRFVEAS
ncbi:MAG: peptidylprolyl isomerase [Myxococcota bacterium]|nr:peptidylprolyl isomerase [Myxococcota bacterium]